MEDFEKLVSIFKDTQKLCSTHKILIDSCQNSIKNQKLYLQEEQIKYNSHKNNDEFQILVSKDRSIHAAEKYAKAGQKVAILNFANSFQPGGGVDIGSKTQEECLCRCSTLYAAISTPEMLMNFYHPHDLTEDDMATDDIIYTPNAKVFKSDEDFPVLLPEKDWFDVDFITCAAPCLYVYKKGSGFVVRDDFTDKELMEIFQSRWNQILSSAAAHDVDVLILGAFGCGAFGNDPFIVANAAKSALKNFKHCFRTVEFAIFCREKESRNYIQFSNVFGR